MDPRLFIAEFDRMISALQREIPSDIWEKLQEINQLETLRDSVLSGMVQGFYKENQLPRTLALLLLQTPALKHNP